MGFSNALLCFIYQKKPFNDLYVSMTSTGVDKNIEIKILLFGATADAVGARSIRKTVSAEMNASELLVHLKNEFPNLAKHKFLLSINQEYPDVEQTICEGDEVAIFTSVSGG